MKLKCVKKCYYRRRTWTPGEILVPAEGEKYPEKFFKPTRKVKVEVVLPEDEAIALSQLHVKEAEEVIRKANPSGGADLVNDKEEIKEIEEKASEFVESSEEDILS